MEQMLVILSGGLTSDGSPNLSSQARIEKALDIADDNSLVVICSAYTLHKPPILDRYGFIIKECRSIGQQLISRGIPDEKIRLEELSYDTIGNAYFTRIMFADILPISNLKVITSAFHMPRSKVIFEHIFQLKPITKHYNLEFITAENGFAESSLKERVAREKAQREKYLGLSKQIHSLRDMSDWISTEHQAYSVVQNCRDAPDDVLDSY